MQLKCKVYDTFLFQRLNRCKKRCLSSPKRASPTSSSTRTWTLQSSVIAKSLSRWAIFHPPSHRHCRREGMQFSRKLRMRICSLGYLCLHGGPLPRSISSLTFLACALFAPLPLGMRTSLNGASRYVQYLPSKFTFTYESAPGPSGDRGGWRWRTSDAFAGLAARTAAVVQNDGSRGRHHSSSCGRDAGGDICTGVF